MRRGVCLFGRWRVTDPIVFFQPSSEMHATCMCKGVALPPYSRSALPCIRVTHYGLSKQMACPQRWYNFLGGEVLRNQMPPQHTRGECNFLLTLKKTKPKNPPCPSESSLSIDFYHPLDPPLIRRSEAAEVVILFTELQMHRAR